MAEGGDKCLERSEQSVLLLQGGFLFSWGCCPWDIASVRNSCSLSLSRCWAVDLKKIANGFILESFALETWSGEGSLSSSLKSAMKQLGGKKHFGYHKTWFWETRLCQMLVVSECQGVTIWTGSAILYHP